ncbi:MAG: DUF3276 family protein [Treponema sp.]|nr:DUF3276 family protein [Treponema sp.]MEE3434700.1 DUF3276 family protein [Treponema sp.]
MGIRGELYTTQVTLANRSYFFNVKENRTGDVFLQIVESKNQAEDRDRHQIAVFEEDMQKFFSGLDESLKFIQKNKKEREKLRAERKAAKEAKYGSASLSGKKVYKKKAEDPDARPVDPNAPKKTGRIHVVSKRSKN